jgi:hypothetical protein
MILQPITENIEEWYIVKIYDNSINIWDYRAKNRSVPFRKINWEIDHLELTIEKWQL